MGERIFSAIKFRLTNKWAWKLVLQVNVLPLQLILERFYPKSQSTFLNLYSAFEYSFCKLHSLLKEEFHFMES